MDIFRMGGGGGGLTLFSSFWGCFFLTPQRLFVDENSTKSQNVTPKNDHFDTKIYSVPCKVLVWYAGTRF